MLIHFYLKFSSTFGQSFFITGNVNELGNNETSKSIPLTYLNENYWHCSVEIEAANIITYQYFLKDVDGVIIYDGENDKSIEPSSAKAIVVMDTWNDTSDVRNVFYTKPFQNIFSAKQSNPVKFREAKKTTHEFKVKSPLLSADECICITGSGKRFKNWDVKKLLPLKPKGNWHSIKINLSADEFPLGYKYGIYNKKTKAFIYEEGGNRIMESNIKNNIVVLHDGFVSVEKKWKGAGVAIPVFSLRSINGFGTGEFMDIRLLVDWAKKSGIKLLQLLPVNDTSATFTFKDSYPYAAISSFALHPLYINIETVAGSQYASVVKPLTRKKKQLNTLPALDYETVMRFKLSVLKELFVLQKKHF